MNNFVWIEWKTKYKRKGGGGGGGQEGYFLSKARVGFSSRTKFFNQLWKSFSHFLTHSVSLVNGCCSTFLVNENWNLMAIN